jgi:hypothetical protein
MDRPDAIIAAVVAANPFPEGDPPPFDVVAARIAASAPSAPERSRRRWFGLPRMLVVGLAVAFVGGGAAALAASGVIGVGAPARPVPHAHPNRNPGVGYGVPVPHGSGLLPLAVPDPAGGPPWGMRYFTTSRGLGCLQVGRIVDGHIGVLGRDGVADDDGLFHPLPLDAADPYNCTPLDAHHAAFLAVSSDSFFASGPDPTNHAGCLLRGSSPTRPECPPTDRRELAYGLLGPDGASVSYRENGIAQTQRTVGRNGAYLIVRRPASQPTGGLGVGAMPAEPIEQVSYRNGTVCPTEQALRGPGVGSCGLVGYTPPKAEPPLPARLTTPLHIDTQLHGSYTLVTVSFRAPVAISNIDRAYVFELRLSGACRGSSLADQTNSDIQRGQRLALQVQLRRTCPAAAFGVVGLAVPGPNAASDLNTPTETSAPSQGETIGHFTLAGRR